ncbi:MAG: rRNA adenine N-6-methyltransferase family protein [Nanoarchaeota archaeon]
MGEPDRGQHYLIDEKIAEYIIKEAELTSKDIVLDIGAGQGALTEKIDKVCSCIAIEIDEENIVQLRKLPLKNTKIYAGNVLKLVPRFKFNKIVANIPYAISEPLFYLLAKKRFDLGIMTIGESFWNILNSETKIGQLFRATYDITKLQEVPKTAFNPAPRTESAIIKIRPKTKRTATEELLNRLLFLDDKKLKNSLLTITEGIATKKQVKEILQDELYDEKLAQLSNAQFQTLQKDITRILKKKVS